MKIVASGVLLAGLCGATSLMAAPLPPKMIGIIPVGGGGIFARTINTVDNEVYEASFADKKIYIIDGARMRVKDAIPMDFGPNGIAYHEATGQILATDFGENTLVTIDRASKAVVGAPIKISGLHPVKVAIDQSLNRAYVTAMHGGNVSVVDLGTRKVIKEITVGTGAPTPPGCNPFAGECTTPGSTPIQVAVNQKAHRVYVASYTENHLTVIDSNTNRVLGTRIPVGSVPNGLGVNETTERVYVANWQDGTVTVIDGAARTVLATVPVGSGRQDPPHCYEAGKIEACKAWGSMPIGDLAVNEKRNRIYVANSNDGTISAINGKTSKVIGEPIPVTTGKLMPDGCFDFGLCTSGSAPRGILFSPKSQRLFVESAHDNWISVLDESPFSNCVPKPGHPDECL